MPFNLKTDFESFPNQIKERFTCAELFIGQIPIDLVAPISAKLFLVPTDTG